MDRRAALQWEAMDMRIDRAAMRGALERLLAHAEGLPGFGRATVRGQLVSAGDAAALDAAVAHSWHDVLSDLDVKLELCVSPADAPAYATAAGVGLLGFGRAQLLGLQLGGTADAPLYRMACRDGMRFDIGLRLTLDADCAVQGVKPVCEPERRIEGRYWPCLTAAHADAFWFVQVQALGKLLRGDYLIAAHLANCQVNETLVMQMRQRDDATGTNVHRYGGRERLAYMDGALPDFVVPHDATEAAIARQLCAAAAAYDALMPQLSEGYAPRADVFYELWRCYQAGLRDGRD